MTNDELGCGCCSEGLVSGAEVRSASGSLARFAVCEHAEPFRVAKLFGSGFSGGSRFGRPIASAGIEHEGVAVFEWDFDRLARWGALVEPIGLFRFVIVWYPLADGLPRWLDGLEGFDVEERGGWWREADDAFPVATVMDVGARFHVENLPEWAFSRVLWARGRPPEG